ncbi:unnamed protein product [Symbiodinium sp. CCMP2592]|nr:unnamed protein product [Symbiodinium sp. CCMP2592]
MELSAQHQTYQQNDRDNRQNQTGTTLLHRFDGKVDWSDGRFQVRRKTMLKLLGVTSGNHAVVSISRLTGQGIECFVTIKDSSQKEVLSREIFDSGDIVHDFPDMHSVELTISPQRDSTLEIKVQISDESGNQGVEQPSETSADASGAAAALPVTDDPVPRRPSPPSVPPSISCCHGPASLPHPLQLLLLLAVAPVRRTTFLDERDDRTAPDLRFCEDRAQLVSLVAAALAKSWDCAVAALVKLTRGRPAPSPSVLHSLSFGMSMWNHSKAYARMFETSVLGSLHVLAVLLGLGGWGFGLVQIRLDVHVPVAAMTRASHKWGFTTVSPAASTESVLMMVAITGMWIDETRKLDTEVAAYPRYAETSLSPITGCSRVRKKLDKFICSYSLSFSCRLVLISHMRAWLTVQSKHPLYLLRAHSLSMAGDPFEFADNVFEFFGKIGELMAHRLPLPSFDVQFDGAALQEVNFEEGKYNSIHVEEPLEMRPEQVEKHGGSKIKVSGSSLSSREFADDFFDQKTCASVKGGTGPAKRCDTGCFWLRVSVHLEGCPSSFRLVLMMNSEGMHKPWYVGSPEGIGSHGHHHSVIVKSTDGQRRLRVLRADDGLNSSHSRRGELQADTGSTWVPTDCHGQWAVGQFVLLLVLVLVFDWMENSRQAFQPTSDIGAVSSRFIAWHRLTLRFQRWLADAGSSCADDCLRPVQPPTDCLQDVQRLDFNVIALMPEERSGRQRPETGHPASRDRRGRRTLTRGAVARWLGGQAGQGHCRHAPRDFPRHVSKRSNILDLTPGPASWCACVHGGCRRGLGTSCPASRSWAAPYSVFLFWWHATTSHVPS